MRSILDLSNWRHRISDLRHLGKPSVRIHPLENCRDVLQWKDPHSEWRRKFVTVHVGSKKRKAATACSATLCFTSTPEYARHHLMEYPLLWMEIDSSFQNDGTPFVTIRQKARRIELAFTDNCRAVSGCWIACKEAFSNRTMARVYLPEGVYEAVLRVHCEKGRGDIKKYRIYSPRSWDGLDIEEIAS